MQYSSAGGGQQAGDAEAAAQAAAGAFGARSVTAGRDAILDRYTQHTRHCRCWNTVFIGVCVGVCVALPELAVAGLACAPVKLQLSHECVVKSERVCSLQLVLVCMHQQRPHVPPAPSLQVLSGGPGLFG